MRSGKPIRVMPLDVGLGLLRHIERSDVVAALTAPCQIPRPARPLALDGEVERAVVAMLDDDVRLAAVLGPCWVAHAKNLHSKSPRISAAFSLMSYKPTCPPPICSSHLPSSGRYSMVH